MSEKKYGVLYRSLPGYPGPNQYICRHQASENVPILSLSRLTTPHFKRAAAMSLDEAGRVAYKWNNLDNTHKPAAVIQLNGDPEEVIDEEEALQYPDAISLELRAEAVRLQPAEKAVLKHLADTWNAYIALSPKLDLSYPDPHVTVRAAVHAIRGVIAMRVAKRADPDVWQ